MLRVFLIHLSHIFVNLLVSHLAFHQVVIFEAEIFQVQFQSRRGERSSRFVVIYNEAMRLNRRVNEVVDHFKDAVDVGLLFVRNHDLQVLDLSCDELLIVSDLRHLTCR